VQNSKASEMFDSLPLGHVICSNYIDYNLILVGHGGSLVESIAVNRRVVSSNSSVATM